MENNNNQINKIISSFHELGEKMCDIEEVIKAIQKDVLLPEDAPSPQKTKEKYKSGTQVLVEKRCALLLFDVRDAYSLEVDTKYKFEIDFTTTKDSTSIIVNHINLFKKE
jgi:hypothetical protein